MKKKKIGQYLFLHTVLLLYSVANILSKTASSYNGLLFIVFYVGVLISQVLYAILWQQVLKRFDLTVAFANKGIVVIWGLVWGCLLFGESVTWNKIVGAIIIIVGILLIAGENDKK